MSRPSVTRDTLPSRLGAGPRAASSAQSGALEWVRNALGGAAGLSRRERAPEVCASRPDPMPVEIAETQALRAELRARLFDTDQDEAARMMRHLIAVHEELGRNGWRGVEAFSAGVVGMAIVQAGMLADGEPSPLLEGFVDRLRLLKVAADARETAVAATPDAQPTRSGAIVEVSETNFDEFELMERSWAGTVPAGLARPARDP